MNPQFSELVHPVISYALDLKERLDNGDEPDLETEQRQLIDRLRSDSEVRRLSDYTGDGAAFLGARYALTCWIDELFIVHSSWSDLWKERILEVTLYGSRDRAWKFWDQAEIVLHRPNTPRVSAPPGPDAVETFFLCLALGFRGKHLERPATVKEFMDEMRQQVSRSESFSGPRDLGITTNAEPLLGRATLGRVLAVYGGVSLGLLVFLMILFSFLRGMGS